MIRRLCYTNQKLCWLWLQPNVKFYVYQKLRCMKKKLFDPSLKLNWSSLVQFISNFPTESTIQMVKETSATNQRSAFSTTWRVCLHCSSGLLDWARGYVYIASTPSDWLANREDTCTSFKLVLLFSSYKSNYKSV